jgi:HK97 family phage prohead protease
MQTTNDIEIRVNTEALEIRAGESGQPNKLVGYAAVYGSLSADLGGFKERVMPGAFKGAVNGTADVRALVDHNPEKLIGRTSANTLKLSEDAHGLRVEVDLPDTSYANDLKALMKRGDVKGMSFGFKVPDGGQRFTRENGQAVRELTTITLKEVSAITSTPAYGDTSLQLRVDPNVIRHIQQPENFPNRLKAAGIMRMTQCNE